MSTTNGSATDLDNIPSTGADSHLRDRRFRELRGGTDIKQLWDHHHEILRLIVLGHTNVHIAEMLGCTPQNVSDTRNSPLGREFIERGRAARDAEMANIAARISAHIPKALKLLEDIIDGNYEGASLSLRAKYASMHLGRGGFGEITKTATMNAHLSADEIGAIKNRAIEAARSAGMIVDTTCQELIP
jgi:transcriptional regulator